MKTTLAVLALILVPSFAAAMGCDSAKHTTQAMSCEMGATWDETTQACVPTTS